MDQERGRLILTPTGDSRVDAAIERLASIEDLDLSERPAVLEEIHDRLRQILGELGDIAKPGPAAHAGSGVPARPGEPGRRGDQGELGPGFAPRPGVPGGGQRR